MTVLTAYINFLPEKKEAALAACRTVRSYSVKEPGCERYDFFQSPDEPNMIVFVEEWTTRNDLEVHFKQDAFNQFAATIKDIVSNPPEIRIFEATLS